MTNQNFMVKLEGQETHFRCDCGCNVFHKLNTTRRWPSDPPEQLVYICNACEARYIGE